MEQRKKKFSFYNFFLRLYSTQENRTGVHLGEPEQGTWKGLVAPSTPIFLRTDRTNRSRVITENRTGVVCKGSSRPLGPYFSRTDRTNRSRAITHLGEPDLDHWKGLVAPSTLIFSSTRSDQNTQENQTGVIGKSSSRPLRPYFLRPDRYKSRRVITHLGEPDRGRLKGLVAPSTPIFFSTYENRTRVTGKASSRPLRPYFFRTGWTNRSRVITVYRKKKFFFNKFFSETIAPRRTGPGSFERAHRALYAHIFLVQIGPIGAEIFLSQTIAPRRTGLGSFERARRALYAHIFLVQIGPKHLGEPDWGHWKELVAPSTPIFSSTRSVQNTYENRTRVTGKGSSRPLRPYFFRTGWTNRSRVITVYRKKKFFFNKFFSETIAPRRTGPGSFERAHRALYAHIFLVQIGPIGAEIFLSQTIAPRRTGPVSLERARRGLYAHIFFVQVGPIGAEKKKFFFNKFFSETIAPRRTGPGSFERAHRALYAHIFLVQIGPIGAEIFLSQTIAPRRTGPGSFERARRALYAHIFLHLGEPDRGRNKGKKHCSFTIFFSGTIAPRRTGPGSFERGRRTLYAHIFCVQHLGERDLDHWKGLVAPSTLIFSSTRSDQKNKGKKHCSLRISLSETIAPRRTEPGLLERARHALYAHIFFVQIGPIEADTYENRSRVSGKGSSRPLRPYFLRTDRTYTSRVMTYLREPDSGRKHFSLTIFFSETIAPTRTGLGSLERARRALYAHIFCVQIGPKVADTYENRTGVSGKGSPRPLRPYFLRTDRTNRSRANGTLIIGKDSSRPLRPYFFRPDRTNRSRAITHLGEPDRGRLKEVVAPSTPIFFAYRSDQ
ncbi:LOW QUALITY PROTEIN: hypothetical protein V1477_015534 [Vespula maculifrons]|uniref:Ribosomal protein S3 n=1 Tax=Vespula maculifrons TaxID=7453 RepID=A0ABD2BEM8_VESMC